MFRATLYRQLILGLLLTPFASILFASALASPVKLEGLALMPPLETRKDLDSDANLSLLDERLSLAGFERLGIRFEQLPNVTRLSHGGTPLEFSVLSSGWTLGGLKLPGLRAPIAADGTLWIPIRVLSYLGFRIVVQAETLLITSLKTASNTGAVLGDPPGTVPTVGPNHITGSRINRGVNTRIVLELERASTFEQTLGVGHASVRLRGVATTARLIAVGSEAVVRARLVADGQDAILDLETNPKATLKVFALTDPYRVVIDLEVPADPPALPGPLANGITSFESGTGPKHLSLLTVDPTRFRPKISLAPWGGALRVLEHAQSNNAVLAVNAGYFDPASQLPVDLILAAGGLQSYARGNRSTLGFRADGPPVFGTPKVRLNLNFLLNAGPLMVGINSFRPEPNPKWVTAFIGDGFVPVGGEGFITLVISSRTADNGELQPTVVDVRDKLSIPDPGQLTVTYQAQSQPGLNPVGFGQAVNLSLQWSDPSWNDVQHAVAAGPKLITNGQYVVNPQVEGFDITREIWRSTRQVAFGLDAQGRYVIALLEEATPEEFARALLMAGVREAMRFDSGSSASVYVSGGMIGAKWGRPVPNALVFVAKEQAGFLASNMNRNSLLEVR
jgi:Phosphodiester glycosidase